MLRLEGLENRLASKLDDAFEKLDGLGKKMKMVEGKRRTRLRMEVRRPRPRLRHWGR